MWLPISDVFLLLEEVPIAKLVLYLLILGVEAIDLLQVEAVRLLPKQAHRLLKEIHDLLFVKGKIFSTIIA